MEARVQPYNSEYHHITGNNKKVDKEKTNKERSPVAVECGEAYKDELGDRRARVPSFHQMTCNGKNSPYGSYHGNNSISCCFSAHWP